MATSRQSTGQTQTCQRRTTGFTPEGLNHTLNQLPEQDNAPYPSQPTESVLYCLWSKQDSGQGGHNGIDLWQHNYQWETVNVIVLAQSPPLFGVQENLWQSLTGWPHSIQIIIMNTGGKNRQIQVFGMKFPSCSPSPKQSMWSQVGTKQSGDPFVPLGCSPCQHENNKIDMVHI